MPLRDAWALSWRYAAVAALAWCGVPLVVAFVGTFFVGIIIHRITA